MNGQSYRFINQLCKNTHTHTHYKTNTSRVIVNSLEGGEEEKKQSVQLLFLHFGFLFVCFFFCAHVCVFLFVCATVLFSSLVSQMSPFFLIIDNCFML